MYSLSEGGCRGGHPASRRRRRPPALDGVANRYAPGNPCKSAGVRQLRDSSSLERQEIGGAGAEKGGWPDMALRSNTTEPSSLQRFPLQPARGTPYPSCVRTLGYRFPCARTKQGIPASYVFPLVTVLVGDGALSGLRLRVLASLRVLAAVPVAGIARGRSGCLRHPPKGKARHGLSAFRPSG